MAPGGDILPLEGLHSPVSPVCGRTRFPWELVRPECGAVSSLEDAEQVLLPPDCCLQRL